MVAPAYAGGGANAPIKEARLWANAVTVRSRRLGPTIWMPTGQAVAGNPLTTGLNGTSPAVRFPPGYGVSLAATVAATTVAAILVALIARRDAQIAIPVSLGIWAITGASVVAVGLHRRTGLTDWGWILIAASVIAAAAGMPLATHRRRASQRPGPRTCAQRGGPDADT